MQYELSDDQVRMLRGVLHEEQDQATETRRDLRKEYGEDSEEVKKRDEYLGELQQLLVNFPDPDAPLAFVPQDPSKPYQVSWRTANDDYPHLNDYNELDIVDGHLVLQCNEDMRRWPVTGEPKPDARELLRLQQYAVCIDDPADYAAAYGVELIDP